MLNVILLGITSLLTDFSGEMLLPLLPFFIQSLGAGGVALGLIFGIGDAIAAILKVVSGYWSDRLKKYKQFVFWGYGFSAVAKFLYPLAASWQHVALIRPFERMGKGFRDAPRDAIISESLNHEERGKGFGLQRAMDSVGAIIGSVFVLVLFVFSDVSLKTIFYIAAGIGLSAVIPIFFVKVPEGLEQRSATSSPTKFSGKLRRFIFVGTLFALANFSVAFFILQAQASFFDLTEKQTLGLVLAVYIFLNIFDAAFSEPAGKLSDRIGRKKVILLGYSLFTAVSVGFLLVSVLAHNNTVSFFVLLGLFALYGLFKGAIDASQRALISDLSATGGRATALGTFETLTGLAAIPAGLIAGVLWNSGSVYTFGYGAVMGLVAVLALTFLIHE
ncbi:MAG: MFS transporter [Candidatus Yanofskybacteria bacterium]|nr:MFS transporter [Candidatus Yanofskybacteria bacterium]